MGLPQSESHLDMISPLPLWKNSAGVYKTRFRGLCRIPGCRGAQPRDDNSHDGEGNKQMKEVSEERVGRHKD